LFHPERLALGRIDFLPSNIPPHKTHRSCTGTAPRLDMLRLALQGNPFFRISQEETRREGVSYLVDTLNTLRGKLPRDASLYFLMGMDSFQEISTWHRYPDLFSLTNFVVISRPGYRRPRLGDVVSAEVEARFRDPGEATDRLDHESGHSIFFHETTGLAISSTEIREAARLGRSIRYLVPDPVRQYILEHGLYRETGDPHR